MSNSTKRVRSRLRQTWLTPAEDATAEAMQKAAEVSMSELLRSALLRYKLPRGKIDRDIANQLLAAMQNAKGGWGQCWSNINQIAKEVNMGRTPRLASLEREVEELRDRVDRDFLEFRTLLMQAMGEERKGRRNVKQDLPAPHPAPIDHGPNIP